MGQIKNIKLHIVTDIKTFYPSRRWSFETSWRQQLSGICPKLACMTDMLYQSCMPNWPTALVVQFTPKLYGIVRVKTGKFEPHHHGSDSDQGTIRNLLEDLEDLEGQDQVDSEEQVELGQVVHQRLEDLVELLQLRLLLVLDSHSRFVKHDYMRKSMQK